MRYIKILKAGVLSILFVLFAASSAVQGQTYSGDAAAARVTITSPAPAPVFTTAVADTGPLPAAGGNVTFTSAAVSVPPVLQVGDSTVGTSGGLLATPPDANTSQSFASANILDVTILNGVTISADAIRVDTNCSCVTGLCTGTMVVTDLRITDPDNNTTVFNGVVTANTNVQLFATGALFATLKLNEQIASTGSITVNGIHVTLTIAGVTTDVIVTTAHSDITCVTSPAANLYSGRATGIRNRERTIGVPFVTDPTDVTVLVADTGFLPTSGGKVEFTTAGLNPVVIPGLLSSGTVTANTYGGLAGSPETGSFSSASNTTVENLALNVGLLTVTATAVNSNTRCTCSLSLPTCVGDTEIANLVISVLGQPAIAIDTNFPPNQTITLPLGLGTITINEQIVVPPSPSIHPENITVNALHIRLTPLGLAVSDTIIASSHSDIDCATAPTAAPVALSGRVIDAYGRGIASAIVTITDGQGFAKSARTNSFGYYVIKGIPPGAGYFVGTSSRALQFTPRFVSLTDNVSGFDLSPDVARRFSPQSTMAKPEISAKIRAR